ncbi:hypothetical protein [Kitasatospora sp. NBC_01302]|uniref:hypothetical protein n=1 Tax=Kitasatospora sp. NBC_01302 TaxID=2903575 RepID=UPI002E1315B3|nr:hypothetical protein OG294_24820 [Kitasatospora sp. NBC_01302]
MAGEYGKCACGCGKSRLVKVRIPAITITVDRDRWAEEDGAGPDGGAVRKSVVEYVCSSVTDLSMLEVTEATVKIGDR